jgi:predicted amidohydrolase
MNNILIKNARIVDGTTDRAKDAVDIMLADGKVQDIGPSLTTSAM